ncbi:hypothetical protein [Mycolicibacterium conceptionense]|uniref:hypothetical protein n=1 Tax=Mycolicibacterium conceptionense TaxID=451644 RepID=UPI003204D6F1
MPKLQAVTDHITAARLATYLAETGSDVTSAIRLYRWNIEMAGAMYEALGVAEVFLRNAVDAQLRIWNAAQPAHATRNIIYNYEWVKTPAAPLWSVLNPVRRYGSGRYSTYTDALRRAEKDRDARTPGHRRHGHAVDHDDVVAHLTFGTWNTLLPRRQGSANPPKLQPAAQATLWRDALQHAFPHHQNAVVIKFWVDRLHSIRNRVAHMEPLLDIDPMGYHRTIARLLRAIDPGLVDWYTATSRIPEVWRRRPR